jgi:hypothetical protein
MMPAYTLYAAAETTSMIHARFSWWVTTPPGTMSKIFDIMSVSRI